MNSIPRILWAVDAFTEEPEQESKLASILLSALNGHCLLEPVFVLRRGAMDPAAKRFIGSYQRVERAAESALDQLAARVTMPGVCEATVLEAPDGSLTHAVKTLIDYAELSGADMIAANTHARSGLERLVLGSFCEELIDQSPIPLWLSNPTTDAVPDYSRALFATDFSERSQIAFEQYLVWMKHLGSTVVLFHLHEPDFAVPMSPPQGFFPIPENWPRVQENEIRLLGQEWVEIARRRGVNAEFKSEIGPGDAGEAILEAADKAGAGLVGMESHSGPVLAALLGSATRQVLRKAHCPLFVYPKKAANVVRRAEETTLASSWR